MILILDYGIGNVYNLKNAIKKIGYESIISSEIDEIINADIVFLPGVGAFKAAMENLKNNNLIDVLNKRKNANRPIVGICLGMQVMFEASYEDGYCEGLGYFKGVFKEFDIKLKSPHMGWNELIVNKKSFITEGFNKENYAYFVHSYYLTEYNNENLICYSDYEVKVPGIILKDNLIGIQFHPEKSSKVGLKILENIIKKYI